MASHDAPLSCSVAAKHIQTFEAKAPPERPESGFRRQQTGDFGQSVAQFFQKDSMGLSAWRAPAYFLRPFIAFRSLVDAEQLGLQLVNG